MHPQGGCRFIKVGIIAILPYSEAQVIDAPSLLFQVFRYLEKRRSRIIPVLIGTQVEVGIKINDPDTGRFSFVVRYPPEMTISHVVASPHDYGKGTAAQYDVHGLP